MTIASKRIALIVLVAIAFAMGGCKQSSNKKIAFVVTTLSNPYFVDMTNAAKEEVAKHPEFTLLVQAPERAVDNERQIEIFETFVTQGVGAICVVPSDSKSIVSAIAKANRANVPVIVLDNKVDEATAKAAGAKMVTFIGSNNFLGGQLAAKHIVEKLAGRGKVAILEGVSGVEAAVQRKAGFLDGIKSSGLQVVASQPADWDREKGLNVTQAMLQANPDLGAIFACNDEMALGAVQAIKSAKMKRPPIVVGFDAIKDALDKVQAGEMSATVAQLPGEVGRRGVVAAVDTIEGRPVQPYIPTEVKLITRDTVQR
jgi:ribose transport system substrate-binding protein